MACTIANIKGFSKFVVKDLLTIRVADLVRCVGALAADAAHWLRAIAGERRIGVAAARYGFVGCRSRICRF
jgi:hypothetical protein